MLARSFKGSDDLIFISHIERLDEELRCRIFLCEVRNLFRLAESGYGTFASSEDSLNKSSSQALGAASDCIRGCQRDNLQNMGKFNKLTKPNTRV